MPAACYAFKSLCAMIHLLCHRHCRRHLLPIKYDDHQARSMMPYLLKKNTCQPLLSFPNNRTCLANFCLSKLEQTKTLTEFS